MSVASISAVITYADVMAAHHLEFVVTIMKGMLSHGDIQHDVEVRTWAAPQSLAEAAQKGSSDNGRR